MFRSMVLFAVCGVIALGSLATWGLSGSVIVNKIEQAEASPTALVGHVDNGETQAPAFSFPAGAPVRKRKSFYDLTPAELDQLIKAYGKLKKFDAKDNRYWAKQAEIHANHCGGDYLEVHGSWWFLPWHHGYLYFYERILASLSDDPDNFALPYWNWTEHPMIPNTAFNEAKGLPSPFFDQSSPLYDERRFPEAGFTFSANPNPNGFSQPVTFFTSAAYINQTLLLEGNFDNFGGTDPGSGGGPGDLELNPHNNVHMWVGGVQPTRDMGDLTYAALDLLFFLHHANIDRLWSQWSTTNANPDRLTNPQWYSRWFNFYDESGKAVSILVDDIANGTTKIQYLPPQKSMLVLTKLNQELRLVNGRVTLPPIVIDEPLHLKMQQAGSSNSSGKRPVSIRLRLEGVVAPHQVPVTVHVFVNNPNADLKKDLGSPNNVGSFTLVPSTGGDHKRMRPPVNIAVDVSQKLAALLKTTREISVTLVPVTPTDGEAIKDAKLTFKNASLIVNH
jgi:polyphenol oxidase